MRPMVTEQVMNASQGTVGSDPVILATAGYDHTVRFWQAHSGICTRTVQHQDSENLEERELTGLSDVKGVESLGNNKQVFP